MLSELRKVFSHATIDSMSQLLPVSIHVFVMDYLPAGYRILLFLCIICKNQSQTICQDASRIMGLQQDLAHHEVGSPDRWHVGHHVPQTIGRESVWKRMFSCAPLNDRRSEAKGVWITRIPVVKPTKARLVPGALVFSSCR